VCPACGYDVANRPRLAVERTETGIGSEPDPVADDRLGELVTHAGTGSSGTGSGTGVLSGAGAVTGSDGPGNVISTGTPTKSRPPGDL
jgi:hypothetical protein